jgi:hypothetical protein
MRNVFSYLLVGLVLATVVEVINMGILGGNWMGMITTLLLVYSMFILTGYMFRNLRPIIHLSVMGAIGLILIEWILIGTTPSGTQSLISTLIFQAGMFFYWATVGFAPRLLLDVSEIVQPIRRVFSRFYIGWFGMVYVVGVFLLSGNLRFVFMQTTSALGHLFLMWFYIAYSRV